MSAFRCRECGAVVSDVGGMLRAEEDELMKCHHGDEVGGDIMSCPNLREAAREIGRDVNDDMR